MARRGTRGADAFGFEEPDHRLHQRVVVRIGHGPDRGADALELEVLGERDRRALTGFNRSLQHWPCVLSVSARRIPRRGSSIRVRCLLLSLKAMASSSSADQRERSVPLGKYSRSSGLDPESWTPNVRIIF